MYTLGINAAYHDSAACLVKDGQVLAAAEEERFTGIKHGKRPVPFSTYELPFHAIAYCLKEERLQLKDIDHVAYSYEPGLYPYKTNDAHITLPLSIKDKLPAKDTVWDPLFLLYLKHAPRFLVDGPPHHLSKHFSKERKWKWHYLSHHLAHAASAFLPSPFEDAAVLTLDGRGESTTTGYYTGHGMELNRLAEVTMPNSLGILYENVTSYLGFLHSSDEYKVMALASYGKPKYCSTLRKLIIVKDNGQYEIKKVNLEKIFGPARKKDEPFTDRHFDIAHSLQKVLEETVLTLLDWFHKASQQKNLCMAGGVALNCVMNARIRDEGPFDNIWVQPAAGDAGTALGGALWVDTQERKNVDKQIYRSYRMEHAYLGPDYKDSEIEKFLSWAKMPFTKMRNVAEQTARLLAQDKIIGWFQGRMEFGPRALGSRSILASPLKASMQQRLNEIKDREDFRPVAPVVLEDEVSEWFENAATSPFMLFVHNVRPEKIKHIPAVCHVDRTARIQTVREQQNPVYYRLLKSFQTITNVPVLVNTSFNTQGKPIVCTPRDALECFIGSPLDCLVMGSFLLQKGSLA